MMEYSLGISNEYSKPVKRYSGQPCVLAHTLDLWLTRQKAAVRQTSERTVPDVDTGILSLWLPVYYLYGFRYIISMVTGILSRMLTVADEHKGHRKRRGPDVGSNGCGTVQRRMTRCIK